MHIRKHLQPSEKLGSKKANRKTSEKVFYVREAKEAQCICVSPERARALARVSAIASVETSRASARAGGTETGRRGGARLSCFSRIVYLLRCFSACFSVTGSFHIPCTTFRFSALKPAPAMLQGPQVWALSERKGQKWSPGAPDKAEGPTPEAS